LLVDRGKFDALFRRAAVAVGTRAFQPAPARGVNREEFGWHVVVTAGGQTSRIHADYLVAAARPLAILPAKIKGHHESKGRVGQMFARLLLVCMRHRWITVGVTVAAFALALFGMNFVQQQFFPSSDRAELVIDWNLPPEGTTHGEPNGYRDRPARARLACRSSSSDCVPFSGCHRE